MMKITGYFSHPIRGLKGASATEADMELNNKIASMTAHMLTDFFPALELYVPADHDEYVLNAYLRKSQTEHEILAIDKIILAKRDILIVYQYQGVISNGMKIEIEKAHECNIPMFLFQTPTEIPELAGTILDWYYTENIS